MAPCPAHDDHKPSLSITENPNGENPLVRCHAGCGQEQVIGALKEKGWWAGNRKSASPKQTTQAQRERNQARIKAEEEASARHEQAAQEAQEMWAQGEPAPEENLYLKLKHVKPHNLRATVNGALLVPVYDCDGQLSSVQKIYEQNGEFVKRYHKGSATGGDHHYLIGGNCHYLSEDARCTGTICIAEGFATTASIHKTTGYPSVVAFQASNLEAVAKLARKRRPNAKIVLCADNDATTEGNRKGNPGVEAATKAAQAVGAYLAIPPAPELKSVDFNDLAVTKGLDAVNDAIKEAKLQTAWERKLQTKIDKKTRNITTIGSIYNLQLNLREHPDIKGTLRLNEKTCRVEVTRPIPGSKIKGTCPRLLTDEDISAVQVWLSENRYTFSYDSVAKQIENVAKENAYNPLVDWIKLLHWDGTKRLHEVMPKG